MSRSLTKNLILILIVLLIIKFALEYAKAKPYIKPELKVNFTEPEIGKATVPIKKIGKNVLFDQAHQKKYSIYSDYSKFVSLFAEGKCKIKVAEENLEDLSDVDILILIAPTKSYSDKEIEAIKGALERGLTLLVMGEKESAENLNKLLLEVGIVLNKDTVYDLRNYSVLYKYPIISKFMYTGVETNVSKIVVYDACSLYTFGPASPVAIAGESANSTLSIKGELAIAAMSVYKKGKIFVVCDTDIFSNEYIKNFDNENFVRNLINSS
jgi:hypothetical protein